MKFTTKPATSFAPVSVTFTLETQKELNALGSLFNYVPILTALSEISDDEKIWDNLHEKFNALGADLNRVRVFEKSLTVKRKK